MKNQTITPPALRQGDTIAFVSPSSRNNENLSAALDRSKLYFERLGFPVKVIWHGALSGPLLEQRQKRVDELHEAFGDKEVKAIICTSGGAFAQELLRYLDYDLIRANPKIFVGYSDIANFHAAFLTQAQLRTFYGPTSILNFGAYPEPLQFTTDNLLKAIQQTQPLGPFPRSKEWAPELCSFVTGDPDSKEPLELLPTPPWTWLRPGKATGRIFAGVLTSFLDLAGTKFWPDLDGAVLLIESSFGNNLGDPVPLSKTRSQLADLANIGVFDQISGLIFGRPVKYSEEMEKELAEILLYETHGTEFPILMNVDVGHTDPMLTIPLDSLVRLDSSKDEWVGLEPGTV